jgi:hypothetical protein
MEYVVVLDCTIGFMRFVVIIKLRKKKTTTTRPYWVAIFLTDVVGDSGLSAMAFLAGPRTRFLGACLL